MIEERVKTQQFFISYNNMNFYKHVRSQCLYNKDHFHNYIVGDVCFINAPDGTLFLHISSENVRYNTVNSFTTKDFL